MAQHKPKVQALLNQFAAAEEAFLKSEFLAPAVPGAKVRVRIAGVICEVQVEPGDYSGWGVFRPVSHAKAVLVREASLAERKQYLGLLPRVRLILCERSSDRWLACAANHGDQRVRIDGVVPVALASEMRSFEVVCSRFDGATFWFEETDARANAADAAWLRNALQKKTDPGELDRAGLSAEQRGAYELCFWCAEHGRNIQSLVDAPHRRPDLDDAAPAEAIPVNNDRARLRESLSHSGAQLIDYVERSDAYTVSYSLDGRRYTSTVDKNDLTVQAAGICLEGRDHHFDLTSLVGVLREGEAAGEIVMMD